MKDKTLETLRRLNSDDPVFNERLETIKQSIYKIDMLNRPWIVFVHPSDAESLRSAIPDLDKKVVIQETENIERGTTAIIKREELENMKGDSIETVEEVLTYNNGDDWEHRGSSYSHSN